MPSAAPRSCLEGRCRGYATYKGRCATHARVQERIRYNADIRKWYSTEAWKALRLRVFDEQPICALCQHEPSTECDHRIPHRGRHDLFWNRDNLQGLCATCHGRKTASGA